MNWFAVATVLLGGLVGSSCQSQAPRPPLPDGTEGMAWSMSGELPEIRYFPAAAFISKDEVLVAGGYRGVDQDLRDCCVIDVPTGKTTAGPPMIQARHLQHALRLPGGALAVVGGTAGRNSMEIFDPVKRQWKMQGEVPLKGEGFAVCELPGIGVAILGGGNGKGYGRTDTEIFREQDGAWSGASPLRTGRFDHTATPLKDGRILVVGGYTEDRDVVRHVLRETRITRDCEVLDPRRKEWTSVQSLNVRRARHQSVLLGAGEVLVVGGYTSASEITDSCEVFSPENSKWTVVERLPQLRSNFQLCPFPGGDALLIGGMEVNEKGEAISEDSEEVRHTYRFKAASRTWTRGPKLHRGRTHFSMAVSESGILIVGGFAPTPTTSSEFLRFR